MSNYIGTIIEESLDNKEVLSDVKILETSVENVTERDKTQWLKKWTLHKVEVGENDAERIARLLETALEKEHPWYADYKNENFHYIIFRGKVFKISRNDAQGFQQAKEYGISLGIPEYQCDFSPDIK